MRPEDRERALERVVERVTASFQGQEEDALADALFCEMRRLKEVPDAPRAHEDRQFWSEAQTALPQQDRGEIVSLLRRASERYANEICGNFNERVYKLSTKLLPTALNTLLNAISPAQLVAARAPRTLEETVLIQGETEAFKQLASRGTLILVPTHSSHLDSMIAGWILHRLGLPPFLYGAGLNLFTNPLLSFFMHNLGAYTVDRRKRDNLYKEVLKQYATVTMELGYHNLFFPGGTRARSGSVERHLKLGLLGSGLWAYVNNLRRFGAEARRIYIVPCTMSYQLVLEAETLIDDHLKESGKSRYIITDDEFSRPRRVLEFVSHLFSLESRIFCTIGQAVDPFGNHVNADGVSLDPRGRAIDLPRYVGGVDGPTLDRQRDAEYTREVGESIAASYLKGNVIQNTNVVARAALHLLKRRHPGSDLFKLLRNAARERLATVDVLAEVERLAGELRTRSSRGELRLEPSVAAARPEDLVQGALRAFSSYHSRPALERRGTDLWATQPNLLFFYSNRLDGYGGLEGAPMAEAVGIIGAGRLGMAFAARLCGQGRSILVWGHDPAHDRPVVDELAREKAPASIEFVADITVVAERAKVLFIMVPARAFRDVAARLGPAARPDHQVLHATKGVADDCKLVHEVIREETCIQHIGMLGGPILASEIRASRPQAIVLASRFEQVEATARRLLQGKTTWILGSRDLIGVEVAGAMRNVIAVAEGIIEGLDLGEPARSMVAAGGLLDAVRLGKALGANPATFVGVAGVGDLVARRVSGYSRNTAIGLALAQGQTIEQAARSLSGANPGPAFEPEGISTAREATRAAVRLGVNLPVTQTVGAIVGGADPRRTFEALLDTGLQLGRADSFI